MYRFDEETMEYKVSWTQEEGEERVKVENIALDETLDDDEIWVGTLVLFSQGAYTSSHKGKVRTR